MYRQYESFLCNMDNGQYGPIRHIPADPYHYASPSRYERTVLAPMSTFLMSTFTMFNDFFAAYKCIKVLIDFALPLVMHTGSPRLCIIGTPIGLKILV